MLPGPVLRSFPAEDSAGRRHKHELPQDADDPDYAWYQSFNNGNQNYNWKDNNNRARAVRRLARASPC